MGRYSELVGGSLIRRLVGWEDEVKGRRVYAVREIALGEQIVNFAKIGITNNLGLSSL